VAATKTKKRAPGTSARDNVAMRDKLGPKVPHLRGCPKVRTGLDPSSGDEVELDLYESYLTDGVDPRDRRLPSDRQRRVTLRVTRCLKCAGHLVTEPDGTPFETTEEDDGGEEEEGGGA
jgi:hypothetical protein